MNYFINKKNKINKKIDGSFGILKLHKFNDIIYYLSKIDNEFMNLIVISKKSKKVLNDFFDQNENFILYRKNKKIKKNYNLVISDSQIYNCLNNFNFKFVYFIDIENLKIKDININFEYIYFLSYNPDLIFFNESIFVKKLLNNSSYHDFEKRILNYNIISPKMIKNKIFYESYIPNLDDQLILLDFNKIVKYKKKIISDYKFKYDNKDTCDICYCNKNIIMSECCNSNLCLECYLRNRMEYKRCAFCRSKYKDYKLKIKRVNKNCYIYIINSNIKLDLDFIDFSFYNKVKIKVNDIIFICYIRKSVSKKKIIFFNVDKIFIDKILNNHFKTLNKYKIVCYTPKYY